ncbi:MAG: hypothetical protein DI598_00275 [Pseudopedobacter saltans]|uniref:Uncharacterized protein n=1 Tax=Pseudopedobacter saltans TaxID=151895 RepID=A0A2W5FEI5_9SPHI|nr:MAG: hypothetical protein DI598_00275 [Pseudopedobacter saltans]
MDSIKIQAGDLLIADPFLKDSSFSRSVVLLCESDEGGSIGFILNKQLPHILGELVQEMEGYDFPVMYGGPVRMDTLHFLHSIPDLIPGGLSIANGVYWGGDFPMMLDSIKNGIANNQNLRLFLGQSGWSNNQLQNEINENTWLHTHAQQKIIFNSSTNDIWKEAVKLMGKKYQEVINYPIDPSLN